MATRSANFAFILSFSYLASSNKLSALAFAMSSVAVSNFTRASVSAFSASASDLRNATGAAALSSRDLRTSVIPAYQSFPKVAAPSNSMLSAAFLGDISRAFKVSVHKSFCCGSCSASMRFCKINFAVSGFCSKATSIWPVNALDAFSFSSLMVLATACNASNCCLLPPTKRGSSSE